jgi:hypothetical protein
MMIEIPMILVALLRLIHIVAAMSWFGAGLVAVFILPISGPNSRFFHTLYRNSRFGTIFAAAGGLTTLAGLLLYATGSHARFPGTAGVVLAIGAVFGLFAVGHGGTATGRISEQYVAALEQLPEGTQPSPELNALYDKMQLHVRISFALMVIALIGMGSARYL